MERIEQFDGVLLKDGTEGCVVEVYGDQELFDVDIGDSPETWDNISVKREDIIKIRYRNKK